MSDTPSISIGSISGGQNNIGKTEIAGDQVQTNNYGEVAPTIEAVFDSVLEAVPEESRELIQTEVIEPLKEEIKLLTALPLAQAEEQKPTLLSRVSGLAEKLSPYAPAISKSLLAFGEASLGAIAPPAGWVASAMLAAIRSAKPGEDNVV